VRDGIAGGETVLDLNRGGSRARVFEFLGRPWVAALTLDDARVIMEFVCPTLLCLDIIDPGALGRLLAEPIKQQLPVGLGD
jgi:hypothetical protein